MDSHEELTFVMILITPKQCSKRNQHNILKKYNHELQNIIIILLMVTTIIFTHLVILPAHPFN